MSVPLRLPTTCGVCTIQRLWYCVRYVAVAYRLWCVCVCVFVRAYASVCLSERERERERESLCVCVHVFQRLNPKHTTGHDTRVAHAQRRDSPTISKFKPLERVENVVRLGCLWRVLGSRGLWLCVSVGHSVLHLLCVSSARTIRVMMRVMSSEARQTDRQTESDRRSESARAGWR